MQRPKSYNLYFLQTRQIISRLPVTMDSNAVYKITQN